MNQNHLYPQLTKFFEENPALYQTRIPYVSGKDRKLKNSEWTPFLMFSEEQTLVFIVIEWTPPAGVPAFAAWHPKNWRGAPMVQGRRIVRVPESVCMANDLVRIQANFSDGWEATFVVPKSVAEASLTW